MWVRVAILLIGLLGPQVCAAGAWLRDKGSGFLAVTSTVRATDIGVANENAIFAEYGLWPKATIGFDYNHLTASDQSAGHALAFLRLPLPWTPWDGKLAVEVAAGGAHLFGDWAPMYKTILSYGRGVKTKHGYGWLSVDAAIERRSDAIAKLDATLGLPKRKRFAPMVQVELAKATGQPLFWAVTPAIRYETQKFGTLVVGLEGRQSVRRSIGVKFALWRDF